MANGRGGGGEAGKVWRLSTVELSANERFRPPRGPSRTGILTTYERLYFFVSFRILGASAPALRQLSRARILMMGWPYRIVVAAALLAGAGGCSHPPVGAVPGQGSGGSAGIATDGGVDRATDAARDTGPSRGPTPATPGIRFPFPQNRMSTGCIYPAGYRNEDVQAAYARWRADTVTSDGAGGHLRIKRPADPGLDSNTTVSEGIGYGMLIAVYMGDADSQHLFDELWKYERLHLDELGLMDWYISADGSKSLGLGGAGDADEDMAFALIMADRQWGGQGLPRQELRRLRQGSAQQHLAARGGRQQAALRR